HWTTAASSSSPIQGREKGRWETVGRGPTVWLSRVIGRCSAFGVRCSVFDVPIVLVLMIVLVLIGSDSWCLTARPPEIALLESDSRGAPERIPCLALPWLASPRLSGPSISRQPPRWPTDLPVGQRGRTHSQPPDHCPPHRRRSLASRP